MKRTRYQIPGYSEDYFYEQFFIQKKKGKKRRICAPSPALKQLQREQMPLLYADYYFTAQSANVEENIHGFLRNKNIVTAATKHIGYATTIQMDISNCFDSILAEDIGYSKQQYPYLQHEDGSLAQGYVTSPILANIYLVQVINLIKEKLDLYGYDYALTSYADDLAISINETDYTRINFIPELVTKCMKYYKLTINPGKTRIRHAKYGNRKILGIMVSDKGLQPSRKLKSKIKAARHQSNGPSLGGLITASKMYMPKSVR